MKFRSKVLALLMGCLVALGVVAAPSMAMASGSDSPTPFNVTVEGLYLPPGDVFTNSSHVNMKDEFGVTYSIHFEEKYADPSHAEWNNRPFNHADPRNQFYSQSFLPWEALSGSGGGFDAKSEFCITWVQVHTNKGYNQHFGEGNQDPIGPGCENPNPPTSEYGEWSSLDIVCTTMAGDVVERVREVTITEYYFSGEVKDVSTTTQTEQYTITEMDILNANLECRTEVVPVIPELTLAFGTCVNEVNEYTPAVVTLPVVDNGVWSHGTQDVTGKSVTLERGEATTLVFSVTDDAKYYVKEAPVPTEQTFWNATKDGNTIVFTVVSNVVHDLDCELAYSGMDTRTVLWGAGLFVALSGAGAYLMTRKQQTA